MDGLRGCHGADGGGSELEDERRGAAAGDFCVDAIFAAVVCLVLVADATAFEHGSAIGTWTPRVCFTQKSKSACFLVML